MLDAFCEAILLEAESLVERKRQELFERYGWYPIWSASGSNACLATLAARLGTDLVERWGQKFQFTHPAPPDLPLAPLTRAHFPLLRQVRCFKEIPLRLENTGDISVLVQLEGEVYFLLSSVVEFLNQKFPWNNRLAVCTIDFSVAKSSICIVVVNEASERAPSEHWFARLWKQKCTLSGCAARSVGYLPNPPLEVLPEELQGAVRQAISLQPMDRFQNRGRISLAKRTP